VVRPAFFILPHRQAAWKILKERLDTLGGAAADLAADPQLGALTEIAATLRGMAGDIGQAHRTADRGPSESPSPLGTQLVEGQMRLHVPACLRQRGEGRGGSV
jgi:hypothetical protein